MTRANVHGGMPEETILGSRVRATTKHGNLTADEIGEMQPGGARLMAEFGQRYWALYYAAREGNWELARYMERESEKVLAILGKVRPKYAADLDTFVTTDLASVAAAIQSQDWAAFESAYRQGVSDSDVYHAKYKKAFIRFRLPDHPPEWFEFKPR